MVVGLPKSIFSSTLQELSQRTGQGIDKKTVQWIGHASMKEENYIARYAVQRNSHSRNGNRVGRPRTTWYKTWAERKHLENS